MYKRCYNFYVILYFFTSITVKGGNSMFRKIFAPLLIAVLLSFSSVSLAEAEFECLPGNEDFDINQMKSENIPSLSIHFFGILKNGDSVGKPVTNQFTEGFTGEIPFYGMSDGYAYVPCHKNIYRIALERFNSIEPVGDDYDILAAYRTTCLGLSSERSHNIQVATKAMSGTIIESGATFNFNEITGPYTEEAGYEKCPITENRLIYYDYGGGVSQVSSTIYAVLRNNPNIEITKRESHRMNVLYLPDGMDASVYNGKQFEFVNRYPFSIQIEIISTDTHVVAVIRRA